MQNLQLNHPHTIMPIPGKYAESISTPVNLSMFKLMEESEPGLLKTGHLNVSYHGNLGNEFTRSLLYHISLDVDNLLNSTPEGDPITNRVFLNPVYQEHKGEIKPTGYQMKYSGDLAGRFDYPYLDKEFSIKKHANDFESFRIVSILPFTKHYAGDNRFGRISDISHYDLVCLNSLMNTFQDEKSLNKLLDDLDMKSVNGTPYNLVLEIKIPYISGLKMVTKTFSYRFHYESGNRNSIYYKLIVKPTPVVH